MGSVYSCRHKDTLHIYSSLTHVHAFSLSKDTRSTLQRKASCSTKEQLLPSEAEQIEIGFTLMGLKGGEKGRLLLDVG